MKKNKLLLLLALLMTAATGAWAQTGENIFQYCYDCQRDPAYPTTTASASLSDFANPLVGYKGSGVDAENTPAGPWKLEYMGLWSTTDQHGIEDFRVTNYQYIYNCTDVPVYRLYQWNATANEYQHASYGVVCAYAKVSNAVEHTAFFEAADGWGCVLTNRSHSSSMNITFDEDLTTGLTTLIAAATPAVPKHLITATYREQTRSLEQPLPYATTIGELYKAITGEQFSNLISTMSGFEMPLTGISSNNTSVVSIGELNGESTPVTVIADGKATISINFGSYAYGIFVSAISPLYAYMKDGVKDADKWTVKVGEGEAQALPIGGLKGDGKETVTLQYNGRLKVKSVTATSDEKPAAWDGTITAQLTAKLAYTGGEIADFTDATDDLTTMTWAKGEHIAILYEVSGTKKVADAEITAVDGTTGAATITFTVEAGTPDNTACTLVYPLSAAKDDHTGVKDAAMLLANQDGTLNANLDVRVGEGTIQTTTPGLTVTTQPEAQFAIFKFTTKSVPGEGGSLQNTNMTELTVTTGGQNYVITPASATSTLYAALPAVDGQTVSFTATDGSNLYAASKASVSFDAAKYYQSTVKMGKVIEVFDGDEPYYDDFVSFNPLFHYLHIDLDQAYAIAKQLSTQNGGAPVAVIYNNDEMDVTCALSTDASATARTYDCWVLIAQYNYRAFLATLWESAQ